LEELLILNSIIIENFNYGVYGNYFYPSSKLEGCIVANNFEGGVCGIQMIFDCEIYANEDTGIENCIIIVGSKIYENGTGISITGNHCTLTNSLIYSNSAYGLSFDDFGMYEYLDVSNSTFSDNYYGIRISAFDTSPEITLINTILYNEIDYSTYSTYGIYDVAYNCLFSQLISTFDILENVLYGNPLFIDPENGDFHFLVDSPCINSGTPDTTGLNLPEYDLDGNPRIYDNIVDMGCYEWQGTPINN